MNSRVRNFFPNSIRSEILESFDAKQIFIFNGTLGLLVPFSRKTCKFSTQEINGPEFRLLIPE
jgi:hypothetical protein